MESIIVRKATEADVPALAETAVWAFEKDPLIMWLGNSPEDRHDICRMMMKSDWRMNSKFDLIYCEDQCRGFAVWMPPDARHSFFENMRMMLDMASVMKGTRRAWNQWQLFRRIDGVHPKKAHYYLSFLGVHPDSQGKGFGPALIAPILSRCDAEGIPAYLETETEKNVRFYTKQGFKVVNELSSGDGAVHVWSMWRDPLG